MNELNAFKQPSRADKAIQASVIAQVRHTAPEESEDAEATEEAAEEAAETTDEVVTRFATSGALRTVTLVDGDIEYCADVMDEESERLWHIAVWPKPPGTDFEASHCFVVGSKGQARDILRSLTGAPAFVPNKGQQALGARESGYAGRGAKKPGRTQQKTG